VDLPESFDEAEPSEDPELPELAGEEDVPDSVLDLASDPAEDLSADSPLWAFLRASDG